MIGTVDLDAVFKNYEKVKVSSEEFRAAAMSKKNELIKIQNEQLAGFCASHSDRFVGFATAALQFPDLAAQQIEHAVKHQG